MQKKLTKKQRDKFASIVLRDSLLFPGEINSLRFYETFMDFIDENEIEMEEADLDNAERELFKLCLDRGYIGAGKTATFLGEDKEKFFKAVKKMAPRTFFQIMRYKKELENKTVSDIFEEYGSNIPAGWIATYCTCGTFYPVSGDINSEMDDETQLPVEISIRDIDTIDIMSDNILRFNMISGEIFECVVLSAMRTVSFLDILKQCS